MTVRDAVAVLKTAKKIVLGYGANAVPFEKDESPSKEEMKLPFEEKGANAMLYRGTVYRYLGKNYPSDRKG